MSWYISGDLPAKAFAAAPAAVGMVIAILSLLVRLSQETVRLCQGTAAVAATWNHSRRPEPSRFARLAVIASSKGRFVRTARLLPTTLPGVSARFVSVESTFPEYPQRM